MLTLQTKLLMTLVALVFAAGLAEEVSRRAGPAFSAQLGTAVKVTRLNYN